MRNLVFVFPMILAASNAAFASNGYECSGPNLKVTIQDVLTSSGTFKGAKVTITEDGKITTYDADLDESNSGDVSAAYASKIKGEMWVLAFDAPAAGQSRLRLGRKTFNIGCQSIGE